MWDVEELPTHGGSLRVYGCHSDAENTTTDRVGSMLERENRFGITRLDTYTDFRPACSRSREGWLPYLPQSKRSA